MTFEDHITVQVEFFRPSVQKITKIALVSLFAKGAENGDPNFMVFGLGINNYPKRVFVQIGSKQIFVRFLSKLPHSFFKKDTLSKLNLDFLNFPAQNQKISGSNPF